MAKKKERWLCPCDAPLGRERFPFGSVCPICGEVVRDWDAEWIAEKKAIAAEKKAAR